MTDWPVKTLGEVCDLVGGGTPSKDRLEFYGGEIPWATVRDLNVEVLRTTEHSITAEAVKSSSSNIIPAGSVVIATRVGLGKAVKIAQDTAINQDLRGLVVKKPTELIADYLYWWYLSTVHLVVAAGTGATVQGVKLPFVSGLAIPVPPLGEQKRIVVLLDAVTARVTELTACYEQARTHANNLFTSALCQMFGDVDTKSGTRLGEICIDIVDCEHKTVPIDETGVAWAVGTRAMSGNQIDFSKAKRISSATYSEWTRRMVPKSGDLILAREAPVGPVVQVPESPKVALGQRTVLIRPDTKVVFTLYLHYLLLSEPIQRSMHFKSEGSVVSHLNVKDVRLLPLPMVPPLEEQKRIVAQLDLMQAKTSEMVAAYDAKLTAAKNLRQSILEAAFAGDL